MNKYSLEQLKELSDNTLMQSLGIEYTEIGEDFLCAKMPVDARTKQPIGLLHGGASAALVETLGSMGSYLFIDLNKQHASGISLNINHMRGVTEGWVYGKASILHKGKTTHVWNVEITNDKGQLVAYGRMTNIILERK